MGRWAGENNYDSLVEASVDSIAALSGPWAPLTREQAIAAVKALIARESTFRPDSVRGEPQAGDASVGLMQVLYSTAQGLGYPGEVGDAATLTGLFDPGTNIYLGTKYLWTLFHKTGGSIQAAWSAYNGGYRPSLGFGARRTASTPVVCLVWKPTAPRTGRTIAQDCQVVGSTTPGEFSNQPYVNAVSNYYTYFFGSGPPRAGLADNSPAEDPAR
jgi:Transglycosylase SLT domain